MASTDTATTLWAIQQRLDSSTTSTCDAQVHLLVMADSTKPAIVVGGKQQTDFIKRYLNVMSDFAFLPDGNHVLTRDYLNGKVWDLRKPTELVKRYSIFPSNINRIEELYDEMRLEDQFPLVLSHDGTKFLTGNYDCAFHEINLEKDVQQLLIQQTNLRYRLNDKN